MIGLARFVIIEFLRVAIIVRARDFIQVYEFALLPLTLIKHFVFLPFCESLFRRRVFVRGLRRLVTTLNDRPGGGSQFSLFGRKRIVGNGGCRSNP